MFDYRISFGAPWYLLLLLLVPVVWWWSLRSLAALGAWRRGVVILIRSIVIVLLVVALAEIQMVKTTDKLTVIYLLDQSLSIPADHREKMVEYVNRSIEEHREHEDRVGVVVFGRDAAIEVPPFDDDVQVLYPPESQLDPEHTDLASAMRLAQASFPEDAAKRVVVVSDGNENLGSAIQQARAAAGAGVSIDVVPIRYRERGEVIVERAFLPSDVRRGQPFDLSVVLTNTRGAAAGDSGEVRGRLEIRKSVGGQTRLLTSDDVTLPPGKRVFTVREEIDAAGFFTYEAEFVPEDVQDDTMTQNNRASAFTHVRGKGQVLLVEYQRTRGEFERLVEALGRHNLEVTVRPSDNAFQRLDELQQYDTVLLGNVPREEFSDAQIRMLVRNTQQMGSGLVMLGGPNSFGAGGWTGTELEDAMPVDFQIKSAKVVPRGALAMIMHATEMGNGNYWQKLIAREALKALGSRDYAGLIHYSDMSGRTAWLWQPGMAVVGGNKDVMIGRIGKMTPGDMPQFDPGMDMAQKALDGLPDAAIKHMIIISDGDASPPSGKVINACIKSKITVSTVAVATHGAAGSRVMRKLAGDTGGKYYKVNNARALPKIFQREARRVAQPLIYENSAGFRPQLKAFHEITSGIDGPLPPVTGYVMTDLKQNPLVELAVIAPEPTGSPEKNRTILAAWTFGVGKTVAFTTDAGIRYANAWTSWENYDKLFGQMVRWSMRPVDEGGEFSIATSVQDEQVQVVVTALDKNDEFLNFLDMTGTVVGPGPDLETSGLKMEQVAPGRYVGTFPATDSGSYMVMLTPGAGKAPLRTGVTVPYSDEFRGRPTNEALLDQMAELKPEGAPAGKIVPAPEEIDSVDPLLEVNNFRHDLPKATTSQDVWFYVVLVSGCLFFFDVFFRRVHVSFAWVPVVAGRARDWVLRRQPAEPVPETIERLRTRKAEVGTKLDQLKASARFEPAEAAEVDTSVLQEPTARPEAARPAADQPSFAGEKEEESYTERLLKAKKKAWEEKKK